MFILCPFGSGKRKTIILNISWKRKCMIKKNTENEFVELKLYAYFDLENRGQGTEIVC
jgi:DNA modification methylase